MNTLDVVPELAQLGAWAVVGAWLVLALACLWTGRCGGTPRRY